MENDPIPPIEALARVLYERMENLAPGTGDYVEWDDLPEWERDLHRHGVKALLSERELLLSAIPFADDDVVKRRVEKRE